MNQELIDKVLACEWDMFTSVPSADGRAICQDDYESFRIMRLAQASILSEEVLSSYLNDLQSAKEHGRNLMTEKYGRMMEYTFPGEYERIQKLLPGVTEQAKNLAAQIVSVFTQWSSQIQAKYPALAAIGRPADSSGDAYGIISSESYLRCELLTMSERTLQLYAEYVDAQKAHGVNLQQAILEKTVAQYGYESLEQANENVAVRMQRRKESGIDQLYAEMSAGCCCCN